MLPHAQFNCSARTTSELRTISSPLESALPVPIRRPAAITVPVLRAQERTREGVAGRLTNCATRFKETRTEGDKRAVCCVSARGREEPEG